MFETLDSVSTSSKKVTFLFNVYKRFFIYLWKRVFNVSYFLRHLLDLWPEKASMCECFRSVGELQCRSDNNNNNNHVSIAPLGGDLRGALMWCIDSMCRHWRWWL